MLLYYVLSWRNDIMYATWYGRLAICLKAILFKTKWLLYWDQIMLDLLSYNTGLAWDQLVD